MPVPRVPVVHRATLDFRNGGRDNTEMAPNPFRCDAVDDPDIALEIERDAAACGSAVTLARYEQAIPSLVTLPISLDTAIECALRAIGGDPLAAAQRLVGEHPQLAEAILACALGLGIGSDPAATTALVPDALLFGRWRVIEVLGTGATAQVARVRDEALSTPGAPVEALIKRYEDALGSEARAHALREMRALLAIPAGLAPRPLALHASETGSCVLITRHEPSRAAESTDDLAGAAETVEMLHRANIAHGDLKPDHLRVRADGSVFLVDFGSTCRADDAAVRADLSRLAAMTEAAASAWSDRVASRVARNAVRRGSIASARMALRAASPRHRRRALAKTVAATAAAGVLVVAGLAFGSWLAAPPQTATKPYAFVDALAATGRLREARIGADGRIFAVNLYIPELSGAPGVLRRDGRVEFSSIRFTPEGRVVVVPSAEYVSLLSQMSPNDQ